MFTRPSLLARTTVTRILFVLIASVLCMLPTTLVTGTAYAAPTTPYDPEPTQFGVPVTTDLELASSLTPADPEQADDVEPTDQAAPTDIVPTPMATAPAPPGTGLDPTDPPMAEQNGQVGQTDTALPSPEAIDLIERATVMLIPIYEADVTVPPGVLPPVSPYDDLVSPKGGPEMSYSQTLHVSIDGMCSGTFNKGDGFGTSADHCFQMEEFAQPALLNKALSEIARLQAEYLASLSGDGSIIPPFYTPDTSDLELGHVELRLLALQPHLSNPAFVGERQVSVRFQRGFNDGGDWVVFKLDDPPANLAFIPFADNSDEMPIGASVMSVGFPASHIEELIAAPQTEEEANRSILELVRDSDIRLTMPIGQVTGYPLRYGITVTETDVSMDYGMSGGGIFTFTAVDSMPQQRGIISGGFPPSGGGIFNWFVGTPGPQLKLDLEAFGMPLEPIVPTINEEVVSKADEEPPLAPGIAELTAQNKDLARQNGELLYDNGMAVVGLWALGAAFVIAIAGLIIAIVVNSRSRSDAGTYREQLTAAGIRPGADPLTRVTP